MTAEPREVAAPDPLLLTAYLEAPYADVAAGVRSELAKHAEILDHQLEEPREAFRQRVLDTLLLMTESKQTGMGFPTEYGGGGDIGASIAAFQTLAYSDLSLLVKAGVQFGLFGGAILHLGSERHHREHLADIIAGRTLGCFAMSETGHGSNVQALETTATYDAETDEFVIQTPTESGRKDYIGNAAEHGHLAVVFAQLVVGGESHGVHALIVPIRDRDGTVRPGVTVEDDGPKLGLKGVDNGRLAFDGVRVAREALLDRYADVDETGTYVTEIENDNRRFFTMLGTLVQGRVSVGGAGTERQQGGSHDRRPVRQPAPSVRAARVRDRGDADDLPDPSATAAAAARPRLRAHRVAAGRADDVARELQRGRESRG